MRKPAGALMIVAAFFCAGMTLVKAKKEHLHTLRELCAALLSLHAELDARCSSLSDALGALRPMSGVCGSFFACVREELPRLGELTFSEIWSSAAARTLSCLCADERAELAALGHTLGAYSLQEQLTAIELCRKKLERRSAAAEKELSDYSRTCLGVCSALGILLAVVLI